MFNFYSFTALEVVLSLAHFILVAKICHRTPCACSAYIFQLYNDKTHYFVDTLSFINDDKLRLFLLPPTEITKFIYDKVSCTVGCVQFHLFMAKCCLTILVISWGSLTIITSTITVNRKRLNKICVVIFYQQQHGKVIFIISKMTSRKIWFLWAILFNVHM